MRLVSACRLFQKIGSVNDMQYISHIIHRTKMKFGFAETNEPQQRFFSHVQKKTFTLHDSHLFQFQAEICQLYRNY